MQGSIWGDEPTARIAQVHPGDRVLCYITTLMQHGSMGTVTRWPYEEHAPHSRDAKVSPYRFGFTVMIRPPIQVPFRPLVPMLDLYGRADTPNWGQSLQTSMLPLTPHDCEVLRTAINQADSEGAVA